MATIQAQIQAKNLDIEERIKQQAELNRSIQSYQARIEVSPVNEQKYAAMLRDFGLAKSKYEELSRKKEISETAQNLEERKAGENLEVLDPASLPEQPAEPNRLLMRQHRHGRRPAAGNLSGGHEGNEGHLAQEPEGRAHIYQPAGACAASRCWRTRCWCAASGACSGWPGRARSSWAPSP